MNQMVSTLKQKITTTKKETHHHSKVTIPYVTMLTKLVRKMSRWNPKYELIKIAVKCNLGSINKMDYKGVSGKWVKIRGVQREDDDDAHIHTLEKGQATAPPIQDQVAPVVNSFNQIMGMLGQLQLNMGQVHERLD